MESKITYRGKEIKIGDLVAHEHKKGVFKVTGIERNFADEGTKEVLYEGFEVGQELNPTVHVQSAYKGTDYSEVGTPKAHQFDIQFCYGAKSLVDFEMDKCAEKTSNLGYILDEL